MGMEKYMGFRSVAPQQDNHQGRELPLMEVAGTLFIIDIARLEFIQQDNPDNRMAMINVQEHLWFSHMLYDTQTKNHYTGSSHRPDDIPDHVRIVMVPPIKELDPVGLARRHGFKDDYYISGRHNEAVKKVIEFSKETSQQKHDSTKKKKGIRI